MTVLLVALGAAVGAPLRYLVDRAVQRRHATGLPFGTLTVNVAACFVLGLVVGFSATHDVSALVGTGFCGALSTYSTFSTETLALLEGRRGVRALVNVGASVLAGLGAGALGVFCGSP